MRNHTRAMILGASLVAVLFCGAALAAEDGKLTVKETPLGQLQAKDAKSMSISADNHHVAVLSQRSEIANGKSVDRYVVSVDGKDQKPYDWVPPGSLTFSADSSTAAYVVQDSKGMYLVAGGVEGKAYHEIIKSDVFAIPGGKSFAYFAKQTTKGKTFVVIAGEEGKTYDEIGNLLFSPDGKRWAYAVRSGEKMYFLINNQPTAEYDAINGNSFTWSPDSQHYGYLAVKGTADKAMGVVVIDGKEAATSKSASRVFFSPDSQRIAFVTGDDKGAQLHLDGKVVKSYDRIISDTIRFSPDSKRIGYIAGRLPKDGKPGQAFYVVDDEEQRPYDQLAGGSLVFSPDSKHVAYVAMKRSDKDNKPRLVAVIDGYEGKDYEDLRSAQFSPDSKRFAYLARREGRTYCVVDNAEGVGYDAVANLTFSSTGKMAYVAFRKNNAFVVLDNVEGKNYAGVVDGTVVFSPKGDHLAYEARRLVPAAKEGEKPTLVPFFVVDGMVSPDHNGSLRGSRIIWDDDSHVRSLILRDEGKIFEMDMQLPG